MGFLWVDGISFFHCLASPFHSFVTPTLRASSCAQRGGHVQTCSKKVHVESDPRPSEEEVSFYIFLGPLDRPPCGAYGAYVDSGFGVISFFSWVLWLRVRKQHQPGIAPNMCMLCVCREAVPAAVLHGESITEQASPRTPTQCTFQPQEAVQPQRNQTILQADTPAQKANYSYKRSHPTPLEADAHTSHVHKNAPARAQLPGGRPPSTCT